MYLKQFNTRYINECVLTLLWFQSWVFSFYIIIFQVFTIFSLLVRVSANGSGDQGSISCRILPNTKRMFLDTSRLNTQFIRYVLRVKWSNLEKGVTPSLIPWCSNYWKGRLRVTLDYGRQMDQQTQGDQLEPISKDQCRYSM